MRIRTNDTWKSLVNLFSRYELTFEEARKRVWFGVSCTLTIIMTVSFGPYHFAHQRYLEAAIDIGIALILISCVFAARQRRDAHFYYRVLPITCGVLFLYSATLGDPGNYRMLWMYAFPPITFFLVGWREGAIYSLLLLAGWVFAMLLPSPVSGPEIYAPGFSVRFVSSFLLVLCASWFMEVVREFYANATHAHSSQLEQDKRQMRKLAYVDELTQLPNRRAAIQVMDEVVASCSPEASRLPLIAMLDIDHFKAVNDQYGHQIGDRVLIQIAERIRGALRAEDFVGRFGGEEFLIVVRAALPAKAEGILEKVRLAICEQKVRIDSYDLSVSASIGATCVEAGLSNSEVIHCADHALYKAKQQGRNKVLIAEDVPEPGSRENVITFRST